MIVGNRTLEVAELDEIRLDRLIAKDQVETDKLMKAAESQGFFYITFNDDLSEKVSNYLRTSYKNSHEFFSKSNGEKMEEFREDMTHGYVWH